MLWLLLGAALTLVLVVDPFGFSPVDGWLGVGRVAAGHGGGDGHGEGLWTCGMHPEVVQDEPGTCPICRMELTPVNGGGPPESDRAVREEAWTCPMHPSIVEPAPGTCPICGMELVPVAGTESVAGVAGVEREVSIDPALVQRMNVRIAAVERRDLHRTIRTVGSLDYDQERMISVTTRYPGFVERVFVSAVGERVRRGQPLFEVYAPELVQTQQELLAAKRYADGLEDAPEEVRRRAEQLVEAARTRLSYWQISAEQIAAVESGGEVLRTLSVVSPSDGVIMKRLHGLEGMAVTPGMEVIHVVDTSTMWVLAEVYEEQLPWLGPGAAATVRVDSLPGLELRGRVRFVASEVSPATRTLPLTIEVPNPAGRLKAGMYATVELEPLAVRDALVVPAQAVIRSGERNVVVVALGDGRFAPREIELGLEANGVVQVLQGLDGSEDVVTSAQFLIDSESNLRAAVDRMRAAHEHGGGS